MTKLQVFRFCTSFTKTIGAEMRRQKGEKKRKGKLGDLCSVMRRV
jgi:hypothetical protein